jgi:hypothetical protein
MKPDLPSSCQNSITGRKLSVTAGFADLLPATATADAFPQLGARRGWFGFAGEIVQEHSNNSRLSTLVADLEQCAKQGDRRQPELLTLIRDVAVEIGQFPEVFQELERRANLVSSLCQPDSRYAAVKAEALANLPSRTETTNLAILADLESLSRQAETGPQHPQFLEQVLGEREMLERLLRQEPAESVYDEELERSKLVDPPAGLTWTTLDCWEGWLAACKKIAHEAKRLEVDGCRILYHVHLDEIGKQELSQENKTTAEVLTMVEDPSLALFLPEIARAAEALLVRESSSSKVDPLTDDRQPIVEAIHSIPGLVGSIHPVPAWLPAGWEASSWPLINDVESMRQWLRHEALSMRKSARIDPKYFVPGDHEITLVRDALRLVRHLQINGNPEAPIEEQSLRFAIPGDANIVSEVFEKAADSLEKVEAWISTAHEGDESSAQHPRKKRFELLTYVDGPEPDRQFFWWTGKPYELTKMEWKLAKVLFGNEPVTYEEAGESVWGDQCKNRSTIEAQISRLNKKLQTHAIPVYWEGRNQSIFRVE